MSPDQYQMRVARLVVYGILILLVIALYAIANAGGL